VVAACTANVRRLSRSTVRDFYLVTSAATTGCITCRRTTDWQIHIPELVNVCFGGQN
jgi:hypothetical protein